MRFVDIEHEQRMAAHHQRFLLWNVWLFSITCVLAFVVTPWLFVHAALAALRAHDHRKARNRALDRGGLW